VERTEYLNAEGLEILTRFFSFVGVNAVKDTLSLQGIQVTEDALPNQGEGRV
jgi:hypothetical protein